MKTLHVVKTLTRARTPYQWHSLENRNAHSIADDRTTTDLRGDDHVAVDEPMELVVLAVTLQSRAKDILTMNSFAGMTRPQGEAGHTCRHAGRAWPHFADVRVLVCTTWVLFQWFVRWTGGGGHVICIIPHGWMTQHLYDMRVGSGTCMRNSPSSEPGAAWLHTTSTPPGFSTLSSCMDRKWAGAVRSREFDNKTHNLAT